MAKKDLDWMVEAAAKLYRRGMQVREAALEAVRQAGINEANSVETFQRAICSALGKRGAEHKKTIMAGRKRVAEIKKMQQERLRRQAAAEGALKSVRAPAPIPTPVPAATPAPAKPSPNRRGGRKALHRSEGQMKIPLA